jgi:hypothetical protein
VGCKRGAGAGGGGGGRGGLGGWGLIVDDELVQYLRWEGGSFTRMRRAPVATCEKRGMGGVCEQKKGRESRFGCTHA